MSRIQEVAPGEPFFLKMSLGHRLCLFHRPDPSRKSDRTVLYVHPFAEEMNKSRRMAAMQARALAAMGFGVLQIDLYGCGDSSGEFCDARWDIWKEDLSAAQNWLETHEDASVSLWGLRLGALLALDFAKERTGKIDSVMLWQPVINGESFMNQFLRLRTANEMLGGKSGEKATGIGALRKSMADGEVLEVGGYELAPMLTATIDGLKAAELTVTRIPIHWFEIVTEAGRPLSPASGKVIDEWEQNGVDVDVHLVTGPSFWATQEIADCPQLILATGSTFACAVTR